MPPAVALATGRRSWTRRWILLALALPAAICAVDASAVAAGLKTVRTSIEELRPDVRLVAVSKFIPKELVLAAHDLGQVDFGENYAQELLEKAAALPRSIRWHFIGRLQSNKVKKLVAVPNLVAIETVDSPGLADRIAAAAADRSERLDLLVQVDTSNEATKGGVLPEEAASLASHIHHLDGVRMAGLMTIGALGDHSAFDRLRDTRETVAQQLKVPLDSLTLSMGMSGDFQEAIRRGATSVRVGSSIFGARPLQRPEKS
ncbi:unnamed protein product [Effrenium voratum]|uniref:Pyridoxal phosphate homeostasis protein n=1 Tax=Effrenium voratum TaxID=2562239 RepID=A0AA36JGP9_9DINO|nr:unnamed protein product [Effrenium voratum]CAJ1405918.1 unnamed protein product [Effrenium voratum]CAJ1432168.1 unnamed protein product [Effrenium voratum]